VYLRFVSPLLLPIPGDPAAAWLACDFTLPPRDEAPLLGAGDLSVSERADDFTLPPRDEAPLLGAGDFCFLEVGCGGNSDSFISGKNYAINHFTEIQGTTTSI